MSTLRLLARGVPRDDHADYAPDSPVRRIHGDHVDEGGAHQVHAGHGHAHDEGCGHLAVPRVITPTTSTMGTGTRATRVTGTITDRPGGYRLTSPPVSRSPWPLAGLSPRPKPALGQSRQWALPVRGARGCPDRGHASRRLGGPSRRAGRP